MSKSDKNLATENQELKQENANLKKQIDCYQRMEVELSTEIDLLRQEIIK